MQQKSNRTDERIDYTKRYEANNEPETVEAEPKKEYGTVNSNSGLYLRDEPDGKVKRILEDKTKLELIKRDYDWYYVSCEDGFKGYVMADYILQMVD